jgi:hypothetical protein
MRSIGAAGKARPRIPGNSDQVFRISAVHVKSRRQAGFSPTKQGFARVLARA